MRGIPDHPLRPVNHRIANRGVEFRQTFGDDGDIGCSDLERSVTTQRASAPAQKVSSLVARNLLEVRVGASKKIEIAGHFLVGVRRRRAPRDSVWKHERAFVDSMLGAVLYTCAPGKALHAALHFAFPRVTS